MKASLIIESGTTYFKLLPESKLEESILKALDGKKGEVSIYDTGSYGFNKHHMMVAYSDLEEEDQLP